MVVVLGNYDFPNATDLAGEILALLAVQPTCTVSGGGRRAEIVINGFVMQRIPVRVDSSSSL